VKKIVGSQVKQIEEFCNVCNLVLVV